MKNTTKQPLKWKWTGPEISFGSNATLNFIFQGVEFTAQILSCQGLYKDLAKVTFEKLFSLLLHEDISGVSTH